jgi:hypothetical protein
MAVNYIVPVTTKQEHQNLFLFILRQEINTFHVLFWTPAQTREFIPPPKNPRLVMTGTIPLVEITRYSAVTRFWSQRDP